jgi:hypothetical protein
MPLSPTRNAHAIELLRVVLLWYNGIRAQEPAEALVIPPGAIVVG